MMKSQSSCQLVGISELNEPPIIIRNTSKVLTQIITEKARSDPGEIPPVLVGRVGSKLYVVNEFETIRGLENAGVRRARATVTDYASVQDLVVSHVRKNFAPQMIDPLRVCDAVDFLGEKGIDRDRACRMLWLDRRPSLVKLLSLPIAEDAKNVFSQMMDQISQKMYSPVLPMYYITKTSRIDASEQVQAALELKSFTVPKMISDAKAAWPSMEIVEAVLKKFHKSRSISPTESRVAQYVQSDDVTKSGAQGSAEKTGHAQATAAKAGPGPAPRPEKKTVQMARRYIESDPNLIYVPIKGTHPDLIVHKKTGRVAIAKGKNKTFSMTDDLGCTTHLIPSDVARHLELDYGNPVFAYRYDSPEKLSRALQTLLMAKQGKIVLLSNVELKKRR